MNSIEQGQERNNFDHVLNYGKKNSFSEIISSEYQSQIPTDEKERERLYFLFMVIESIFDINNDFIQNDFNSKILYYSNQKLFFS